MLIMVINPLPVHMTERKHRARDPSRFQVEIHLKFNPEEKIKKNRLIKTNLNIYV